MRARTVVAALVLLASARAVALPSPTRGGEVGLLDVPDAEVMGTGRGLLGAELRFDRVTDQPGRSGPLPAALVMGVGARLDLGLALREWGQPGDPVPSRPTFGAAAKLKILASPSLLRPSLAIGLTLDRFNAGPVAGARLIASSATTAPLRLAAFAGLEGRRGHLDAPGVTAGAALAVSPFRRLEAIVEAAGGPRGANLGAALRVSVKPTVALQLALNYLPSDDGLRVSLGVALGSPAREEQAAPATVQAAPPPPAPTSEPTFDGPRPRFRLKLRRAGAPPRANVVAARASSPDQPVSAEPIAPPPAAAAATPVAVTAGASAAPPSAAPAPSASVVATPEREPASAEQAPNSRAAAPARTGLGPVPAESASAGATTRETARAAPEPRTASPAVKSGVSASPYTSTAPDQRSAATRPERQLVLALESSAPAAPRTAIAAQAEPIAPVMPAREPAAADTRAAPSAAVAGASAAAPARATEAPALAAPAAAATPRRPGRPSTSASKSGAPAPSPTFVAAAPAEAVATPEREPVSAEQAPKSRAAAPARSALAPAPAEPSNAIAPTREPAPPEPKPSTASPAVKSGVSAPPPTSAAPVQRSATPTPEPQLGPALESSAPAAPRTAIDAAQAARTAPLMPAHGPAAAETPAAPSAPVAGAATPARATEAAAAAAATPLRKAPPATSASKSSAPAPNATMVDTAPAEAIATPDRGTARATPLATTRAGATTRPIVRSALPAQPATAPSPGVTTASSPPPAPIPAARVRPESASVLAPTSSRPRPARVAPAAPARASAYSALSPLTPARSARPAVRAVTSDIPVERIAGHGRVITFTLGLAPLHGADRESLREIAEMSAREGTPVYVWACSRGRARDAHAKTRTTVPPAPATAQVVTQLVVEGRVTVDELVEALRRSVQPGIELCASVFLPGEAPRAVELDPPSARGGAAR